MTVGMGLIYLVLLRDIWAIQDIFLSKKVNWVLLEE